MIYDVVFIDWDGTLSTSRFWGHWAFDTTRRKDYDLIQKRFFQGSSDLLQGWMRGTLHAEDAVELISNQTGIHTGGLMRELQHSCEQMRLVDERVPAIVNHLRAGGTKVVIATDNMDTFTRWTAPALRLGERFDEILSSHTLKACKKDTRPDGTSKFFADFFARSGVSPTRTLLVDDSAHNHVVKQFGVSYAQVTAERSLHTILSSILNT